MAEQGHKQHKQGASKTEHDVKGTIRPGTIKAITHRLSARKSGRESTLLSRVRVPKRSAARQQHSTAPLQNARTHARMRPGRKKDRKTPAAKAMHGGRSSTNVRAQTVPERARVQEWATKPASQPASQPSVGPASQ
jgi:hypothetical protein